jgi:hypothetical protein
MSTNANSALISALLADAKVGTFTGLVTKKVGTERGPKGAKVRYGDDEVHVCVFTGFKYVGLCERSLVALAGIDDAKILDEIIASDIKAWEGRGKNATEVAVRLADVKAAREELVESLSKSIAGTNESTTDDVFEPLVVDGKTVRGARVYTGQTEAAAKRGDKPAAKTGTIYLQGLQISSRVITPAPNGPKPESKSGAKTVAKNLLRRRLPVSRYVSYKLEPGSDFLLRSGGTAEVEAEKAGIHFTPEMRDAIKRSKAA